MPDKPTGGVRLPDYLRENHLARLESLMVEAMPWPRIVAILKDEGLCETDSTARAWRAEIHKRWATEDVAMRPARKDLWRARIEAQYCSVLERAKQTKSDYAFAMLSAEATRIAKVGIILDGVASPIVHKVEGQADIASMSPLERDREIAELIKRRDEASRRVPAGEGGN